MANGTFEFYSNSLHRIVELRILLPNDLLPEFVAGNPHFARPAKTLLLLHGYSCSGSDWLLSTAGW